MNYFITNNQALTRIILALILAFVFNLCLQSQSPVEPIAGQNLRIYAQAHASLSKLALRYTPPDRFDVNPWVFRPSFGVAIGAEYPLKNARWITAFSAGYQVHDTRRDSYRSWDVVQSGYQLRLGINRQIGRKVSLGFHGWHISIQQGKTRNRITPFDFAFFDKNWAGLSYTIVYKLFHKVALTYSFSHGRKIAQTESYRINGTLYKTTQYSPVWMNLGGRFYLCQ